MTDTTGNPKRRAQRAGGAKPKVKPAEVGDRGRSDRGTSLNTFLTTIVAAASLAVAFAQFRLAEQQARISKSLAQLEFAKAAAKFEFDTSGNTVPLGPEDDPHSISLPDAVTVKPISGVKDIFTMDGPIELTLTDEHGGATCNVEVRGLYLQQNKYDLQLSQSLLPEFQLFLGALRLNRVGISDASVQPLVRYHDLLGNLSTQQYLLPNGMEIGGPTEQTLIMYSGAWSGGTGFHFDQVDPASRCPQLGKQVKQAATSAAL
jgi:hypothetical protein